MSTVMPDPTLPTTGASTPIADKVRRARHDYDDSGQAAWAGGAGIDVIRDEGRIDGPGRVRVGHETYTPRHVVLATGSEAVLPPVPGLQGLAGAWTNRDATGLTEVPRRLLALRGGPVG